VAVAATKAAGATETGAATRGTGATDRVTKRGEAGLERYSRPTRWFHAAVYVTTLLLLATGWWLTLGKEGEPSVVARLFGVADVSLHKGAGWALAAVGAVGIVAGRRAAWTFLSESVRFRRGDAGWLQRWPAAIFTGRFGRHDGHFDPGQRVANLVMALGIAALVGSGIGLVVVHGGPAFVWLSRVHRWATYVLTPVVVGHIAIALGIFPGYRGVWRSMHVRGRVGRDVANRLWPGWTRRTLVEQERGAPEG
jgi:cytochrome b subunit of formate dehydrogenase